MKKIIIRPIQAANVTMELKFDYFDKTINDRTILTTNYRIFRDEKFMKTEKPLKIQFSGPTSQFVMEWEEDDEKMEEAALVMKRHPLVKCQGNDNMKNPFFELIDLTNKIEEDVISIKKKGLVFNLINNATLGKMRDMAFSFGYNPTGISYSEVFTKLVDFGTGILMQPDNIDRAITALQDSLDEVYVVMKKALALKIIVHKDGIYYVKSDIAGGNEDALLLYLKTNVGMYENFVRKEVALKDNLPVEETEKVVQKALFERGQRRRATTQESLDFKELQEEAKKLGIKATHLYTPKNLTREIERVKNKQKAAEQYKKEQEEEVEKQD